ncbi:MAG: methyltransferase, partial [Bacteroidota bacterium]
FKDINLQKALVDSSGFGNGSIKLQGRNIQIHNGSQLLIKNFGFQRWKNFDYAIWKKVQQEAIDKMHNNIPPIYGYDLQQEAIDVATRNVRSAKLSQQIILQAKAFEQLTAPKSSGIIVTNPPYEERLRTNEIEELYQRIGDQLKQNWGGWNAWLLSSNFRALKKVGLRPSKKTTLYNGALECKFLCYEMYAGSKKAKYQQ